MKIAVVADEDTVNCVKLAGLNYAYLAKSPEGAEKRIHELTERADFAVVITSDHIANKIRATISEITEEQKYPLIISIPTIGGPSPILFDSITELIKRKTGIELKV